MNAGATAVLLLGMLVVAPATAQQRLGIASLETAAAPALPDIAIGFANGAARWSDAGARPALLKALSEWLAAHFELPSISEMPRVLQVAPNRISAMRYGPLLSSTPGMQAPPDDEARRNTVAIYVDRERTIYLPENFTAGTPAELSILLHEMVHHMQNMAGLRYECPAAREKLAYRAQARWLDRFGLDLAGEFQIDPFTVMVRGACMI